MQSPISSATLPLADWQPRPQVRAPLSEVTEAAYPCIDAHNHLGTWLTGGQNWMIDDPVDLIRTMDRLGVEAVVNLDGRWGDELSANLERYDRSFPGRFATFAHFDWSVLQVAPEATWSAALVRQVEDAAAAGARGFKVWKDLGLSIRDSSGVLVPPDHPCLQPAFDRAGALGLPVLIHTADPVAFFDPIDRHNERLDELGAMPEWWFGRAGLPTFGRLMSTLENLVASTPRTTFIGAHVGCHAEDLSAVAAMMRRQQNFCVDIGGRIAELGRTPRAFARLVREFPDRVLFGTDAFPLDEDALLTAFRFVQTDDEAFSYAPGEAVPPQGRWLVSGAALEDDLMPAFYGGNARRVLATAG